MQLMITEAQLYELLHGARDIEYLEERIERLRASLESASPSLGRIGSRSSDDSDKMATNIAKLMEMQEELTELIAERETLLTRFEEDVAYLPNSEKAVVKLRYGLGLSWEEVAQRTNFSARHCTRLHQRFKGRVIKRSP